LLMITHNKGEWLEKLSKFLKLRNFGGL